MTLPRSITDLRLFFQEFRRTYHTTGAIAPSGRALARALARFVATAEDAASRQILEIGPGTGAVTRAIVSRLRRQDRLDLVELNDRFVARLRELVANDPCFALVASRTRIFHQRVQDLPAEPRYDAIVSGLPLNNFSVSDVKEILDVVLSRLAPGGVFSFFEYVAIRPMKAAISGSEQRQRLRGIAATLGELLARHEFRRDLVWPNLPPAWVHHVRNEAPAPLTGELD